MTLALGRALWVYDPGTWKNGVPSNNGFVHRGVSYWADGKDSRIVFGTGDGYLICLHAKTGKPVHGFGKNGRIDLTQGLGRPGDRKLYGVSSPPAICRDVIVMGSKVNDIPLAGEMPPGDVRGFDVRTGKLMWSLGRPARGHLLLTKAVLIIGQEGSTQREGGSPSDVPNFQIVTPNLIAFDKSSGKRLGEVPLPHNATAAPMTYMHQGKQFLVVAPGGGNFPAELIAFAL